MKANKWPLRPIHITEDGEKYRGKGLEKLSGPGIIPSKYLRGIQRVICARLGNPTTIVEYMNTSTHKIVGTDSTLLEYGFHPACKALRDATDVKLCRSCDWAHAGLFYGLKKESFCEKVEERIKKSAYISKYREKGKELHFEFVKQKGERPYLEYDCPLLGYRELLFPIFFEEKIIGAFFCGELVLKDKEKFIKQRQCEPLKYLPQKMKFLKGEINPKELMERIRKGHDEKLVDLRRRRKVYDRNQYRKMIRKIKDELDNLEDILDQEMDKQRMVFVASTVENEIAAFRKGLQKLREIEGSEQRLDLLWENIERRLKSLRNKFDVKNIAVYGIKEQRSVSSTELEQVLMLGEFARGLDKKLKIAKYKLAMLPPDCKKRPITSDEKKELFNAFGKDLGNELKKRDFRLRFFPGSLQAQPATAVLIGYKKNNPSNSKENMRWGHLDRAIQSFYTIVSAVFASVRADITEEYMKAAFKFWGHETGQLTAGFDALRLRHLSSPQKLRKVSEKEAENVVTDIEAFSRQFYLLSSRPNIILTTPVPKRESFYPYGAILCKWEKICRLEAVKKDLQINAVFAKPGDKERPKINADRDLLEQLVYNLVGNAVKYCQRGTVIWLDCKKMEKNNKKKHVLTVTNYGPKVEEGENVYKLYYRGKKASEEEGMGVGLFIAKRIAEAHGGEISHYNKQVSVYNVPLIEHYIMTKRTNSFVPDEKLKEKLSTELTRLKAEGLYEKIVARSGQWGFLLYQPVKRQLSDAIMEATYEVVFEIVIP